MVGCAASPVYREYIASSHIDVDWSILLTTLQLLELFGIGLTLTAILHAATNALDYQLQRREMKWYRFLVNANRALTTASAPR